MESQRERPARPPPPASVTNTSDKIRRIHDESYLYVQQGLSCDEDGQTEQAVTLYKKGLNLIDKGLKIAKDVGSMIGIEWDNSRTLVTKMKKTKTQIEERVKVLIETDAAVRRSISDPPPSYDMSLQENIMDDQIASGSNNPQTANASEIFKIPDGVQMFFITPEGNVSAPSYPSSLGIYKFTDKVASERPPAFLQVGNWNYPLVPGRSPALQSIWGAYVFPDVESQGSSIGVIIPDSVLPAEKAKLERHLGELTAMRTQVATRGAVEEDFVFPEIPSELPADDTMNRGVTSQTTDSDRTSAKVAKGLVTAAEWISWGLGKGAEKAGDLMKKGSNLIQDKIQPDAEGARIDPRAQQGVYYAREATGAAVKVSGFIITKLGEGTVALARMAAPHLRTQGEKILPKALMSKDSSGHSKVDDVTTVAVGGLQSWATVFVGLETAAKALASSLTKETVGVVKYKYGNEAGQITENGMFAACNFGMAAYNVNNLGVKAIAKRAAKDTGKAVIEDYHNKKVKTSEENMDTDEVKVKSHIVKYDRNGRDKGGPSRKPDFSGS